MLLEVRSRCKAVIASATIGVENSKPGRVSTAQPLVSSAPIEGVRKIVMPKGIGHIAKRFLEILEDGENGLPGMMRQVLDRLGKHLKTLDAEVVETERNSVAPGR